jgi:Protein of unknown function (DUF1579)
MNTLPIALPRLLAVLATALLVIPSFAQGQTPAPATSPAAANASQAATTGQPNQAEMMAKMMEMTKLNDNHKLLGDLAGTWNYKVKFWMNPDPKAPPSESSGISVTKAIMGGRYYTTDVNGMMKMPGADGKMKDVPFKGMAFDGYDNVKQKFLNSWIDNMGTGIVMAEGTYDAATKTFTYTAEMEMMPGMKQKVREMIKIVDKDHHTFEYYEDRGGQEAKTMEINYTRKK